MAQQGLGALGGHGAAEAGAGAFAAGGRGSFLSVKLQAQVIPRPVDDDQEEAWPRVKPIPPSPDLSHLKDLIQHQGAMILAEQSSRGNPSVGKQEVLKYLFFVSQELDEDWAPLDKVVDVLYSVDLLTDAVYDIANEGSKSTWLGKQQGLVKAVGAMLQNSLHKSNKTRYDEFYRVHLEAKKA